MRDAKLYNSVRQLAFVRGLRFSFRAGRVELWRAIFTGTLPEARAFLRETPRSVPLAALQPRLEPSQVQRDQPTDEWNTPGQNEVTRPRALRGEKNVAAYQEQK